MEDLVELGRLSGAYGFRGWVRVVPFESGEVLEKVRRWVLISPSGETTPVEAKGVRRHGGGLIAKWDGCESKEAADALGISQSYISRLEKRIIQTLKLQLEGQ